MMNTILWILQGLLAAVFLFSGLSKSLLPEAKLVARGQTGVEGLPPLLITSIGIVEILGAVGLVVPWWSGIVRVLTPVAAIGLGIIMLLAAPIHRRRGEHISMMVNVILAALCGIVVWGRMTY